MKFMPTSHKTFGASSMEIDRQDNFLSKVGATSELLFVILPFIVIAITLAHRGELSSIFSIPEWSIVSAVIVGQSVVKIVSTVLGHQNVNREPIILWVALLLVCVLVPVLVVLSIVLTSNSVSRALSVVQAVLFVVSATIFWAVSWVEAQTTKEIRDHGA